MPKTRSNKRLSEESPDPIEGTKNLPISKKPKKSTHAKPKQEASEQIPFNIPDLYLEITTKDFKMRPDKVMLEQYLSPKWKTRHAYRIPCTTSGCYLVYDLHKNPHYQLHTSERLQYNDVAQQKEIPVTTISQDTFEVPNEIYHYTSDSNIFKTHITPMESDFFINNVIHLLDKCKEPCKRGNLARSFGWHGLSYKFGEILNLPTRSKISVLDKNILRTMTKLVHTIYHGKLHPVPFFNNTPRAKDFSNALLQFDSFGKKSDPPNTGCSIENVFESMTYAMTYLSSNKETSHLLKNHIDSQNCHSFGYNAVFGIYFVKKHPTKLNTWVRVVFLGYSRKSVSDYYKRMNKRALFKEHLQKYFALVGSSRATFNLTNSFPWQNSSAPILHFRLPFIDKCGFYSIFVSPLHDLIESKRGTKNKLSLEDILELALPIVWLRSGANYYLILKKWEKDGIPNGNLTFELASELISIGGNISSGPGPRMQPFFNKPVDKSKVLQSLNALLSVVKSIQSTSFTPDFLIDITRDLKKKVIGCGHMGAQHIISVLTLLGVIKDARYVRETTILKKTNTESKIKHFYGLNYESINVLYKEIADETFGGCTRKVENLGCEFLRDIKEPFQHWDIITYNNSIADRCKGSVRYPDLFYSTQALFVEEQGIVSRLFYDQNGNECKQKVNDLFYIRSDKEKKWDEDVSGLMKIKQDANTPVQTQPSLSVPQPTIASNEILEESTFEYFPVQRDILNQYKAKFHTLPHMDEAFSFENNWFNGGCKNINSINLLQRIGLVNMKRNNQKKKVINILSLRSSSSSNQHIYSATVMGKMQLHMLTSTTKTLCTSGFVRYDMNAVEKRNDYIAYYSTKAEAQTAIKVKMYCDFPQNILHVSFIWEELQKYSTVALFENKVFYALLNISDSNEASLYFPQTSGNQLLTPWSKYDICFNRDKME